MRIFNFKADKSFEGKKLSSFLTYIGCSSEIIKMLKKTGLSVNGNPVFTVYSLKENDEITIVFPDEKNYAPANFNKEVQILYSDEDLAIVNKPAFLPMHQSIAHYEDTLANHFAFIYPNCCFRAVTRLDKNTSGLCVVALNKLSAAIMCRNRPKKLYYAIAEGYTDDEGVIEENIARESEDSIKRIVSPNGQCGLTEYKTLKRQNNMSLLELSIKTGRTHQIRVHLSYIGHSLLGDELYGGSCEKINRQALHCGNIKFTHPITKELLEFNAPLPKDMKKAFFE